MRRGALDIHHSSAFIKSDGESYATTKRKDNYIPVRTRRDYHKSEEVRDDEDDYRNDKEAVLVEDSRDEVSDERGGPSSKDSRNSREPSSTDKIMVGRKENHSKYPVTPIRRSSAPYYYHHHQHNHHHYFAPSPPGRNLHECNYYNSPIAATEQHYYPPPASFSTPPCARLPRKKRAVVDKHNKQDRDKGFAEFKENSNPQADAINPKKQRLIYTRNHESDRASIWAKDRHLMDTSSITSEYTLPKSVTQEDEESQSIPAVKSFDTENDLMTMIQTQMSWNSNATGGDVSSIGDMTDWQDNDDHSSTSAIQATKDQVQDREGPPNERIEKYHDHKDEQKSKSRENSICDSTTSSTTTTKTNSRSITINTHSASRTRHIADEQNHDDYNSLERSRYQYYDNQSYYEMMRQPLPVTPLSRYHHPPPPPPLPPKYMTTPPPRMPYYWQPYSAATASSPSPPVTSMDPLESRRIADHVSTLTPPYPSKLPLSLYKHRCTLLKPPLPSKSSNHQSDDNHEDSEDLPCFSLLINYPSVPFNNVKRNSLGFKYCIMCGLACPIRNPTAKTKDEEYDRPTIPAQNKGLCTHCDVAVWVAQTIKSKATRRSLEIKWCKGCKNFHSWAAFGTKGLATKCTKCRNRQKEKYHAQKKEHEGRSGTKEKNK
eukprot:CAMPEP_0194199990 /NCGR_PEP_ID=MMETSP0156-20130528/790_1 /TAXON_ID=33649 /ORGANISM="Thalassionema nitzschioides, Strain L26-B" /LENGTH=657 /DNA_ID=CAMNT_0038924949 /DNA_START=139 /DNA_END=2112 /DNA_ORIENTATION=-